MATIQWSGRTWDVADSSYGHSPGFQWNPNIPIDANGWLHLNLEKINGTWYAPMIYDTVHTGYGMYQVVLQGIHAMDPNAVLGLFPYSWNYGHELDIEQAQWGDPNGTTWDFVVQPASDTGTPKDDLYFSIPVPNNNDIICTIIWTPIGEEFTIEDSTGKILQQWSSKIAVNADSPSSNIARMFINLYPRIVSDTQSVPPASNQSYVLKSFTFVPDVDNYYDTVTTAHLSTDSISLGETVTITGNVSCTTGPMGGAVVELTSSNGDVIQSPTTDANGNFSMNYTPSKAGNVVIMAYYHGTTGS